MFLSTPPVETVAAVSAPAGQSTCLFRRAKDRWTGSCGPLFDEAPVFTIAPAKAVTTGVWKRNVRPRAVWAGVLASAGDPDYPVEIEVYADGAGLLRSEYGWYAIAGLSSDSREVRFRIDASHEVAPGPLDLEILRRADALLNSEAVWNRADDRRCPPAAVTWSIYCAGERATREVTGGFHHRRPAMELVREIIEARTKGRPYHHRLMDYNNDPTTTLADVRSLFAEALRRVPDEAAPGAPAGAVTRPARDPSAPGRASGRA